VRDIIPSVSEGQRVVIIHLGDHDPSGLDMTRDLQKRIEMFSDDLDGLVELERIALNMGQIKERNPPPNPAKTTDSRFAEYQREFGNESWELDALPPAYLVELVQKHIDRVRDADEWKTREREVGKIRTKLRKVAKEFKP
jgi:hypothetical protein